MATTKENNSADYIVDQDDLTSADAIDLQDDDEIPDLERHFDLDFNFTCDRLDKVLAALIPDVSRARVKAWIEAGDVRVNGDVTENVRLKVGAGDTLDVTMTASPQDASFSADPQVEVDVIYEDDTILVINKPVGLVVHPAAGHWSGTLLNGLLARYPELSRVPRAGIVHRLDRETSGLMVVARTEKAQTDLVRQLQARSVGREYWALVLGVAPAAGFVDRAIGRDPRNPLRFVCRGGQGSKTAMTHCRLVDVAQAGPRTVSWVACRLDTGRTHQIRVHLSTVGLPLLGDPLYKTSASKLPAEAGLAAEFSHQALHASRLTLVHPATGQTMSWFVEPPQDMIDVMDELGFGPVDEPVHVFD